MAADTLGIERGASFLDAEAAAGSGDGWPRPQPLTAKTDAQPYPLDALPDVVGGAVAEVQAFVQAPDALVAGCALSAVSLSCQAHIDVERAEGLGGPVGLYLLTGAESGERKTTADKILTKVIRDHEARQAEAMKPEIESHRADMEAWTAEREGVLSAIREASKSGKPTDKLRGDLEQLHHEKPEPPRLPRLLLGDETPESLAWSLARHWPSAGVLSSEAGVVFGAHGMGKDSAMRNLALLNVLWDGGELSIGRKTSESFTLRGARLTVGLQVQPDTLREYLARSGQLARGTGFLARFLLAMPESTQGTRQFREPPTKWPALAAFHRRVEAALEQPAPVDKSGALVPQVLTLSPAGRQAWIAFHDAVETELAKGGELELVRDVASKSADNCARLAALFHYFEGGQGSVSDEAVERASRIAAWHLSESRRFFGELALPPELADAVRLDTWLAEYGQRGRTHIVATRDAQRLGPIRDKGRLDGALEVLAELDRARVRSDGKRKLIVVNPALVAP